VVTAIEIAIIGPPAPPCSPRRQLDPEVLGDYIDRLYRAAWAFCGSREESEDLVQETFARVLRKPRMLCSEDDLRYLLRVLRNTFISARRAAARRPQAVVPPDTFDRFEEVSGVPPEARIEAAELYALISTLPPVFRETVVAIDVVGLSYNEARPGAARSRGHARHPALPRPPAARSRAVRADCRPVSPAASETP
jgi:RNA polymerase sigma-70 factor (ECF subfamily)